MRFQPKLSISEGKWEEKVVEGGLKKLKKTVASDKLQAWPKSLKKWPPILNSLIF